MHNPLSDEGRQIVMGSMLGDGYLDVGQTCRHARFEVRSDAVRQDYIFWKYKYLQVLCNREPRFYHTTRNGKELSAYHLRTVTHSMFTRLRNILYPQGHRIVSGRILNSLTSVGLAVWYMDDGNLCVRDRLDTKSRSIDLHIERYMPACCDVLRRWFQEKFGIMAKLAVHYFSYVQERVMLYLRFPIYDFYHTLRPVIADVVEQIPSMRWKLDFQYAAGKSPDRRRRNKPGQSAHQVIRAWLLKHPEIIKKFPHAMPS